MLRRNNAIRPMLLSSDRYWWIVLSILFVGSSGILIYMVRCDLPVKRGSHITRTSYEKISIGMLESEVETLIGLPPGNYAAEGWVFPPSPSLTCYRGKCNLWMDDGIAIRVWVYEGRVTVKECECLMKLEDESNWEKIISYWERLLK